MNEIHSLFKDFTFIDNTPVLKGMLPQTIFEEVANWAETYRAYKDHPLSFLREHKNAGMNSYQVSILRSDLFKSYLLPFLNYLGEYYIYKVDNIPIDKLYGRVVIGENKNHFDDVDIWLNYSYKNDENPKHSHAGSLSGVIYIKNISKTPTYFNNTSHAGEAGEIIIFPANLLHGVEKLNVDEERTTIAYNLDFLGVK